MNIHEKNCDFNINQNNQDHIFCHNCTALAIRDLARKEPHQCVAAVPDPCQGNATGQPSEISPGKNHGNTNASQQVQILISASFHPSVGLCN